MKNENAKLMTIKIGGHTVSRNRAAFPAQAGVITAFIFIQDEDQIEAALVNKPLSRFMNPRALAMMLPAQVVFLGILVHDLGTTKSMVVITPAKPNPTRAAQITAKRRELAK